MILKSRPNKNTPKPLSSPFNESRNRYETFIPLLKSFRFVHEPIGTTATSRFIGRQSEMESLAERILFSEGGSFLVTGYRGVGKTSFINQVVRKLEEALPWAESFLGRTKIVDIYLNVARPVQPSEIMHHIIRQLHDRLIEKGIYHLLDDELKDALTLSYYRTSVNMARKLAESSERSFGFNEASIGGDWMKAALKMSWNSKRSRTQNYEVSFLGYEDKAAEHDIINISRRLVEGYTPHPSWWERLKSTFRDGKPTRIRLKIVFVFDELDKLEEFTTKEDGGQKPVIDHILGGLKNLFTTSGVTFVFVAGKDLQERWLEDVGKGDSVYESVFSYDKYLPCLWADVDSICDRLVDRTITLKPYDDQIFTEFKKYLAYKGRGIPRRIIRTFNEYVEWSGDRPVLAFTRQQIRNIRFYAGLQDTLTSNEKQLLDNSHEEVIGTHSDKRRLGIYYLIDWILRQGSTEFTLRNVLHASRRLSAKIALAEEIAAHVADIIIKILLDADYIQEVNRSQDIVIIDHADALRDEKTRLERRYRIAPRRLGEMGGLAADVDLDMSESLLLSKRSTSVETIGKYKIVTVVGRGGMGTVYAAMDESNGRKVAVKVLADNSNPEMVARFEREAIIMNELNHPNIVRLYDWGTDDGRPYIAMEYLDGITLEEVIKRHGKLSIPMTIAIAQPVVEAVNYVHRKGFVRNDIKPSNVILTPSGRVCLLDFGITKPASSTSRSESTFETKSDLVIGTPMFMAPEQLLAYAADRRSDIYSLGVMLYNMLTGVFPFKSPHVYESTLSPAPPPSQHAKVPTVVDAVVLKCLKQDPKERFQSMSELAEVLSSIANNLPSVDLRSALGEVRAKVKKHEKMDNMRTRDSYLYSPGAASYEPTTPPPSRAWPSGYEDSMLLESIEIAGDTKVLRAGPSIRLKSGAKAAVDFHRATIGLRYYLEKKTSIGRSSENAIVLRDEKISRFHAELYIENKSWFVKDLNSGVGTIVNGMMISNGVQLFDGDEIRLGDFVFVFNEVKR